MKTGGKIALGVIGLGILVLVLYGDQLPQTSLTTTPTQTGSTGFVTQPTTNVATQKYNGGVTVAGTLANAQNSTTFTDATHANLEYFYKDSTGAYNFMVTSASNTATVPAALTGGFVYVNIDILASQAVYTDVAGTIAKSPDVKGCVYDDPDKDNMYMYVCQIDISQYIQNPAPALTPRVGWIASFWGEGSIDLNSPTGITDIATGNTLSTIDWDVTLDELATAEAVRKVQVRLNTTTSSLVVDDNSYIQFPWGQLKLSDMSKSTDYSNTRFIYEKFYPTQTPLDGAKYFLVGNSGSRTINVPMTIMTGFTASTDALCVELEVTTVNARGTVTTTAGKNSDDVELTAGTTLGAGGSIECTI